MARSALPGSSFELFAQAMLDHWMGKPARITFERDDGYLDPSPVDTYFWPANRWPKMEREAMKYARGRILDLGCGPGRHALYLQSRGFQVVGLDASPTQVALARVRGVREVYPGDVRRLPKGLGTFDTALMMGNNLGLAGDAAHMRRFLRDLRSLMRRGGRLVGHSRIPGTWSDDHLPYVKWNVRRGRPAGLITLRIHYKGRVGDWFDLYLLEPEELIRMGSRTGWELTKVIWEGGYSSGDYVAVLEAR